MGLIAETVAAEPSLHKGSTCTVGQYLTGLAKNDREELLTLFASAVQHSVIARALKSPAITTAYPNLTPPQQPAITRHRNRNCACPA